MSVRTVAALVGIASLASLAALAMILAHWMRASYLAPGATLIRDENTRLGVLARLFPNALITEIPGKRIDSSGRLESIEFPDALKDEKVYDVDAPPIGGAEECASGLLMNDKVGHHRLLRFKLFSLGRGPEYIAAMQYKFSDGSPPFGCQSMARLSIISQGKRVDDFIPDMTHHNGWQSITFADLSGRGTEDLIVESDWGGGGGWSSQLFIFDLASNKLHQLLKLRSRDVGFGQQSLSRVDVARTAAKKGQEFCFTKTTYEAAGETLRPPKDTHPCYPPGTSDP